MVTIGSIMINVSDIGRASGFWGSALGFVPRRGNPAMLEPASGEGLYLQLDEDDRTHLDLHTANREEQKAEVERLVALGATRVEWDYPAGADFVVLADTEGNLFCVIDTSC